VAFWSVKLNCDSQGCIANLKNPLYSQYAKYIAMSFQYAREAVAKGHVDIRYVESARNVEDILTKPMAKPRFQIHRKGKEMITSRTSH
jgi:hypothetical protein